jgi:transcription elongation factor Elf1
MTKFLKETPVHLSCPACGKTQRAKLKWAKNHKSLKCKDCGKNISLKEKPARDMIAKTARVTEAFASVLEALHVEAKKAGKAVKAKKGGKAKKSKKAKKSAKPSKAASKKTVKRRAPAKPASMMPASPAPGSELTA